MTILNFQVKVNESEVGNKTIKLKIKIKKDEFLFEISEIYLYSASVLQFYYHTLNSPLTTFHFIHLSLVSRARAFS